MPRSDFERGRIFIELFVFKISKNRLPAGNYSEESKIEPWAIHIFDKYKMFLVSSVLHAWLIFFINIPSKAWGVLQNLKK
jgi:hypothetical protein